MGILRAVRVLAAIGVVAAGVGALATSAYAHGFSPRVAAGLSAARAPLAQLSTVSARSSHGATFVQVRQHVGGVPVLGASATLSLGADGERMLLDHTRGSVRTPLPARLTRAQALARARASTHASGLRGPAGASLVLLPRSDRLAWRVTVPSSVPLADFEVLVDARSGQVLRTRNLLHFASTQALVFDPNPVVEQGSRTGLIDDNNQDSGVPRSLYRTVTLEDLDPSGCLAGEWVNAIVTGTAKCPSARDFSNVTRGSNCRCFEAAMAYFHIDRMQHYLQSLGFNDVVHRAIPVNLHATSDDNSFYSPSTGSLNFGDGGVNDAQDADVIDHEYGHAIQDSQVRGFGDSTEGGTLGEGFGDYWEAAMSAATGNSDVFNTCFAEWDTSFITDDALPCLRRVDQQWTVDQAVQECGGHEIHCVGQAWSNLLWTIRKQLGGTPADKLIVQSQFSYSTQSGFRDAALALLFADRQLDGGANQTYLHDLLVARGFLTDDQLDDEPDGALPLAFPGQVTGAAGATGDTRDVFKVPLSAGTGVVFHLRASAGSFFTLILYPPGTSTLESGTPVKSTSASSNNTTLGYVPTASGTYYLAVIADSGQGTYIVDSLPDADRDGVANANDNCPATPNPTQSDWNHNGRGDACDRASRTTISRLVVHGHTVTVTGALFPAGASPATWFVEVRKSGKLLGVTRGVRGKRTGQAVAVVRLAPHVHGRVEVRALLRDRRFAHAASKTLRATIR